MIRIAPQFSKKDLQRMHDDMQREIEADILREMIEAAKAAIEIVRSKQGARPYEDRTGNLNSSTGFVIARYGKIVHSDFRKGPKGTDGVTGLKVGRKIAKANVDRSAAWNIVLVAGMEYASFVQAKDFDALGSAMVELPNSIGEALQELNRSDYE